MSVAVRPASWMAMPSLIGSADARVESAPSRMITAASTAFVLKTIFNVLMNVRLPWGGGAVEVGGEHWNGRASRINSCVSIPVSFPIRTKEWRHGNAWKKSFGDD